VLAHCPDGLFIWKKREILSIIQHLGRSLLTAFKLVQKCQLHSTISHMQMCHWETSFCFYSRKWNICRRRNLPTKQFTWFICLIWTSYQTSALQGMHEWPHDLRCSFWYIGFCIQAISIDQGLRWALASSPQSGISFMPGSSDSWNQSIYRPETRLCIKFYGCIVGLQPGSHMQIPFHFIDDAGNNSLERCHLLTLDGTDASVGQNNSM
jgi:hypothetical protein